MSATQWSARCSCGDAYILRRPACQVHGGGVAANTLRAAGAMPLGQTFTMPVGATGIRADTDVQKIQRLERIVATLLARVEVLEQHMADVTP